MESQDQPQAVIVWFRQDLRIGDNAALTAATKTGLPILPLYIYDDETADRWTPGAASRWWLEGSLAALDETLRSLGSRLILRRGGATEVLKRFMTETRATGLYFTRLYEPHHVAEEKAVADYCERQGLTCRRFGGGLLFEPEAIRTRSDGPFRVFTPFYKACLATGGVNTPLPAPGGLKTPKIWPKGETLDQWGLRPTAPDWAGGLRDHWQPGTKGASDRLDTFLENRLAGYPTGRDRPDHEGTSALSPHLHFGEISPRQIWHRTRLWADVHPAADSGRTAYLRELVWREFSCHLLYHFPTLAREAFNKRFEGFPWRPDADALVAWKKGRTGYPIVDAGMRQLWHTGWMHNRVRMIVASFLTKHLLVHWRDGARWFWDTLVDADLANNSASWQWVAGCGADAAPYFRIFNPILQGEKFDREGDYVRRWVPELAELPDREIHTPWKSSNRIDGYPDPIIDHKFARQRALDAYKSFKDSDESVS